MTEPILPTALSEQAKLLKASGVSLPNNPDRANESASSMIENAKSGKTQEAVNRVSATLPTVEGERAKNNQRANMRFASSLGIALDKKRLPMQTMKNKGIPHAVEKQEDRKKVREWCRLFYGTHNLMATAVDIYSLFPIQGVEVQSKDPQIKKFYETLFFDQLDYESFLEDFGREYFTVGEVNCLGTWNEVLGVWESDQIINPDDVLVQTGSLFSNEDYFWLQVPESVKEIIKTGQPSWEYKKLKEEYPELFEAATLSNNGAFSDISGYQNTQGLLSVSPHILSRAINKITPWDKYGTPHMMRAFNTLMMEESLNAAQDAVADRLYSPMILAKLGSENGLGDGQGPWIPEPEELDSFTSQMNSAFSADFRFLAYHFGIDIKSVFGKESMPNFDKDYDRLERKMLQVWGIGEGLISGSSSSTYASSALNREFVTQLMSAFQKKIQAHFKKRAEIVAEAQGHFDTEGNGVPIYEEVLETDPDTGEQYVKSIPKLMLPTLKFRTMNLRDETVERGFLQTLKQNGIPVSDSSFMTNIELEFDEELEKIKQEKIAKVVAEQEMKVDTYKTLKAKGLPVPEPLEQEMSTLRDSLATDQENLSTNDEGLPNTQGRPENDLPQSQGRPETLPDSAGRSLESPSADPMPASSLSPLPNTQGRPLSDVRGRPTKAAANESIGLGEAIPDITSPLSTPNVAPNEAAEDPNDESDSGGWESLPRNEISQRPEISDEQRSNAPKKSKMGSGPSVVGKRSKLTHESIKEMIRDRNWTKSISEKPKVV